MGGFCLLVELHREGSELNSDSCVKVLYTKKTNLRKKIVNVQEVFSFYRNPKNFTHACLWLLWQIPCLLIHSTGQDAKRAIEWENKQELGLIWKCKKSCTSNLIFPIWNRLTATVTILSGSKSQSDGYLGRAQQSGCQEGLEGEMARGREGERARGPAAGY